MTRTENFLSQNFFQVFLKTTFFSTIHATLIIMSRKYFLRFSKSAHTLRYTILDSRDPLVMRSRKAGLPFATRAWKRELSIQEVRIENDSDRKFFKSKYFPSFSENHFFFYDSCYPDHYEPKIFFSIFEVRTYPSIHDFGLEGPPCNAISEGRPPLCNTSLEAGALDTGGTYRE